MVESALIKPDHILNILVLNAHWYNRGDEAAIRAMIDSILSMSPTTRIRIMLASASGLSTIDDAKIIQSYPTGMLDNIDSLVTLLARGKLSFTARGRAFLKALGEADAVIHAPGGPSIGDIYGNGIIGYQYLYRLLLARAVLGKFVFFYAPSMGPFNNRIFNLARRYLLSRVGTIVVRDEISAQYLKMQLGLDAIVTADAALQNSIPDSYLMRFPEASALTRLLKEERVIGVTATSLGWHPLHASNAGLKDRIMRSLSESITHLTNSGYRILLLPQLFGEQTDLPLLEELKKLNPERIDILHPNIDAYGQQVVISKLFFLIGMRYHSAIFAAKAGTPFISISYEHKSEAFVRMLGLNEICIDVNDISSEEILQKCSYIEKNYDAVKTRLSQQAAELRAHALVTVKILADAMMLGHSVK